MVSPKGVGSPERAISPSASDEPTSEDSEIKLRSGASSRSSLRMSLKKLISPEELEKVLSPEELKHVLGEMEMVRKRLLLIVYDKREIRTCISGKFNFSNW